MSESVSLYLQRKGHNFEGKEDIAALLIQQLQQKDKIISNLEALNTKYKCEDIKNQKIIKTLQDKISQLAPSDSNTGSNFMMASEFKAKFQQFMTSSVSLALGGVIDRPFLFSKCMTDIFNLTYTSIDRKIDNIISNIINSLNIDQQQSQIAPFSAKIKMALINIFQQHWHTLFPYDDQLPLKYKSSSESQLQEQLNEMVINQDYLQMRKALHELSVYMILQEKPWQFINLDSKKVETYFKKQYVCLDGWIKDGQNCLILLQGLKKGTHLHPNLKNFVIPFDKDDNPQLYSHLVLVNEAHAQQQHIIQLQTEKENLKLTENEEEQEISITDRCELFDNVLNTLQLKSEESMISKNKSAEFTKEQKFLKEVKENNYLDFCKKSKKKEKNKASLETSLKHEKSPKNKKKHDDSLRMKKISPEDCLYVEEKIQALKEQMLCKKKNSTAVTKNISQDLILDDLTMLPMKRRQLQEMPLRKKTKPATSRKNSVGKIVSQHVLNQKDGKENCSGHANGKGKTKEKIYKDIIKEKLIEDKIYEKIHPALALLHPKSKTERDKKKQENRPLKIQGNVSKLRQKYMS